MKQSSLRTKLQYLLDNVMSKGTLVLIGVLFGITILVAIIAGVLTILIG